MGKIRENMEKLVSQVHGSIVARHHGVASVRLAARDLLGHDHREAEARRKTLGQAARRLSTELARERQDQLRAASALRTGLETIRQERRAGVRQAGATTRGRLSSLRVQRASFAAEAKKCVRGEVGEIRTAVGALRGRVRATMGGIAKDVAEAGRLWRTPRPRRRK